MSINEKAYRQAECKYRYGCGEKALREFVEAYEAANADQPDTCEGGIWGKFLAHDEKNDCYRDASGVVWMPEKIPEQPDELPTEDCTVCKGQGWYAGYADDKNGNRTDVPIQIQCGYCHATGKQASKKPAERGAVNVTGAQEIGAGRNEQLDACAARREALEWAAQRCRYYFKNQNFTSDTNEGFQSGTEIACSNLSDLFEKEAAMSPMREVVEEGDIEHWRNLATDMRTIHTSAFINDEVMPRQAKADMLNFIYLKCIFAANEFEALVEKHTTNIEAQQSAIENNKEPEQWRIMKIDLSKIKSGDKVLLRDGSKIIVDDRGGKLPLMVFMTDLSRWKPGGAWSEFNPNCDFDIVGIIKTAEIATHHIKIENPHIDPDQHYPFGHMYNPDGTVK